MGTRSITVVNDYDGSPIINLYRQFDGYPEGHGRELAKFLASGKMVNGLGSDEGRVFNGPDCLAAQLVAHLKRGPGNIYLRPPAPNPSEEFVYVVQPNGDLFNPNKGITIEIWGLTGDEGLVTTPETFEQDLETLYKELEEE